MQITKNQHYVPRFYMKHFSAIVNIGTRKEKALISFYQFKDSLFKDSVPTASICSEDYFYDEDGTIENKLAEKEKKWSGVIYKINNDEILTRSEIDDIREFAIYQLMRTKAILGHTHEIAKTILTETLDNQNDSLNESIKELIGEKVEKEITPEYNLELVKDCLPLVHDLTMKVVNNKTDVSFITSDVPVIVINPLGIERAGLGDIGTVIFFPVSQKKMVIFYDSKLYGNLKTEIQDLECINAFNKYQYISADERILALNSGEFHKLVEDSQLKNFREKFHDSRKATTNYDGNSKVVATKSRSIGYYFNIPILKLPKQLRKIPQDFRETFPRNYEFKTRRALLCRIYREPDFIKNELLQAHWKQGQYYSKILLEYLDYYWDTPAKDRIITGEFMRQLKSVPVKSFLSDEWCINHKR